MPANTFRRLSFAAGLAERKGNTMTKQEIRQERERRAERVADQVQRVLANPDATMKDVQGLIEDIIAAHSERPEA